MENPNEQAAQQFPKTYKVIIAVNTSHGIGYFVDSEGNKLFNKQFERVRNFFEGLASVKQDGKSGFINTQGEVIVPCIYDDAESFSEGFAFVLQNDKCSLINKEGKVLVAECNKDTHWSKVEME